MNLLVAIGGDCRHARHKIIAIGTGNRLESRW